MVKGSRLLSDRFCIFEFFAQEGHIPSSFLAAAYSHHPPYFTVVGLLLLFDYHLVPKLVSPLSLLIHLGIADLSNHGCGADTESMNPCVGG